MYGSLLEMGRGVSRNPALAGEFYERSAMLEDAGGLILLGICLEFGKSIPKDTRRAYDCYVRAGGRISEGAANAGFCAQHGLGIERDYSKSVEYYRISIANIDSISSLGLFGYVQCLQYGLCFDESVEEASSFYELIAAGQQPIVVDHSFRCLRSLNKARFNTGQFPGIYGAASKPPSSVKAVRPSSLPLPKPPNISAYVVDGPGFSVGREIGGGSSSEVKALRDPKTGKRIAVKYFRAATFNKMTFIREVEILGTLNHPCVLQIVGWAFPKESNCAEIHTELAEYGSLSDVLCQVKRQSLIGCWTRTRIGMIICDIVVGMRYIHSRHIVHRDLKPSNILIGGDWRAKIGDFGSSRFESDDATLTEGVGTVHYAAPEMFEEFGNVSEKVDVYGFGLVLYEVLFGQAVFPTSLPAFDVIRQLRARFRPVIPNRFGSYVNGLIYRCWSDDPSSRPSFNEILGELQNREFDFLLGANSLEIGEAVTRVLQWELTASPSGP
jgi:hypothetical protein